MRINPRHYHNGLWVPEWLLVRPEITASAKVVYGAYARHAHEMTGASFPSQFRVAAEVGETERTVRRSLVALIACGLMEQQRLGKRCTNRYFFLEHEWMQGLNPVTGQIYRSREGDRTKVSGDRTKVVPKGGGNVRSNSTKEKVDNCAGARAGETARPAQAELVAPHRLGDLVEMLSKAKLRGAA